MARRPLALAIVTALLPVSLAAQWLTQPTAGVPRTPDGKPNLTAPAPRGSDGKPDLTGVWNGPDPNPPTDHLRCFSRNRLAAYMPRADWPPAKALH